MARGHDHFSISQTVEVHLAAGLAPRGASPAAKSVEGVFDNGLGAFVADGQEYCLRLPASNSLYSLPPQPWIRRDAATEHPFASKDMPLMRDQAKSRFESIYVPGRKTKAVAISSGGNYFFLTGIHFVHLLIGFVVLGVIVYQLRSPARRSQELVETCATYWHTVDFLWVLIFALLYVVR